MILRDLNLIHCDKNNWIQKRDVIFYNFFLFLAIFFLIGYNMIFVPMNLVKSLMIILID